ncbi:MAG: IS3 family transposase [Sellimonas intestinalis]
MLNDYLVWYNETGIKKSLGYMSPMKYRRSFGLTA